MAPTKPQNADAVHHPGQPPVRHADAAGPSPLSGVNHFSRLPDRIIAKIMLPLDAASLACVVRVCRFFARAILHEPQKDIEAFTYQSFVPFSSFPFARSERDKFLAYIERDYPIYPNRICRDCKTSEHDRSKNRKGAARLWSGKLLHCSFCHAHHPPTLFSDAQRQFPPRDRVCIAAQGHVRLCEHHVYRWADIKRMRFTLKLDDGGNGEVNLECHHSCHQFGFQSLIASLKVTCKSYHGGFIEMNGVIHSLLQFWLEKGVQEYDGRGPNIDWYQALECGSFDSPTWCLDKKCWNFYWRGFHIQQVASCSCTGRCM